MFVLRRPASVLNKALTFGYSQDADIKTAAASGHAGSNSPLPVDDAIMAKLAQKMWLGGNGGRHVL